ncbi:MAG: hypothetical protein JNM06_12395 [Blastocatellia bacterium]|nr:hypothetical protein [Blastocatellia bacterium]
MSPGMKFRRSCNSCNTTFFAEDRKAPYCPKCAKKKAAVPIEAPKPINKPSSFPATNQNKPFVKPNSTSTTKQSFSVQKKFIKPKSKPRLARQPKTGILTDELREKIIAAYHQYKITIDSPKKLHSQISQELWVKPKLVADTITQLRKQEKASQEHCSLSEKDRERVLELYLKLINENIRPVEGRRNHIANQLSLPHQEVILAVREWSNQIMGQLSREQLFLIEKEYWDIITNENNHRFSDLPKVISERLKFASHQQVFRWLDQLHDNTKLIKVPDLPLEQQQQLIEAYQQYLSQSTPPEKALHTTLSKVFGVKPLQVHKTLCDYRCQKKPS